MNPRISCQCCLLRPPDKSLRKCYRKGGQEEVYSIMLEDCFELQLREGGICEICVARLRDACDFKRQVQCCQRQLQDAVNEAAETKVKQEEVDLPIDFLDDGVKSEPSDSSDDGLEIDQDYPVEVEIEWKTEALDSPEECEPEASGVPRTDGGDESHMDSNEDEQPIGISHSSAVVRSSRSLGSPAVEEAGTESKGRKRRNKPNETKDSNCTPRLSGDSGPNPDKKKPTGSPARKDKLNSNPEASQALVNRASAVDAHEANVRTLIQHSNCTPFLTRTIAGIRCCYCEANFLNLTLLREHMQSAHTHDQFRGRNRCSNNGISCKIDITDLKCKLCERNFNILSSLKDHLIEEHDVKFMPEENSYVIEFKLSDGEVMNCALCSATFETFKTLLQHMNEHYRNFVCEECDMGFLNERKLIQHQLIHNEANFKCSYCPKVFTTCTMKLRHENCTHRNSTPIRKCPLCEKTFTSYYVRNKHLLEDHNSTAASYKCSICDKLFPLKEKLSNHMKNVHLKVRNHKCPDCGDSFFFRNALKEHMVRHNGEKIHKCTECNKAYARKGALNIHRKKHSEDRSFVCGLCGMPFARMCFLKNHTFREHGATLAEFD